MVEPPLDRGRGLAIKVAGDVTQAQGAFTTKYDGLGIGQVASLGDDGGKTRGNSAGGFVVHLICSVDRKFPGPDAPEPQESTDDCDGNADDDGGDDDKG